MRLNELEQCCGECRCIDYCAEPFEDLCLCCDSRFAEMEDEENRFFPITKRIKKRSE